MSWWWGGGVRMCGIAEGRLLCWGLPIHRPVHPLASPSKPPCCPLASLHPLQLRLDWQLRPGDVQLLSNHTALHSRQGFVDDPQVRLHWQSVWLGSGGV